MGKEGKIEKHPAHKEEDLEIKTPEELEEAKKKAGVPTHKEALERYKESKDIVENVRLFDPEKDIKEKQWKVLLSYIEIEKQKKNIPNSLAEAASVLKIIDPEKLSELGLDSDKIWQDINKRIDYLRTKEELECYEAFHLLADMKIMNPEKSKKIKATEQEWKTNAITLTDDYDPDKDPHLSFSPSVGREPIPFSYLDREQAIKERKERKKFDRWTAKQLSEMKIVDPEKFSEAELDQDEIWQGMKDVLEELHKEKDWKGFTDLAASMRIIDPERFSSEIYINKKDWKEIKNQIAESNEALNDDREFGFDHAIKFPHYYVDKNLLPQLKNIGILSADKVEFDENGLKIE